MLQHIIGQAGEQAGFFSGYVSVLLMSVLFFAATSAFFFKKGRGAGAAATVLFLISAGFLAGLRFCDGMIRTASYAGLMFCFLAAAVFYIFTEYREISLLLLNALASLAVMLFTSSSGHRVYLPFCLWLLTALAWILSSLSGRWRPQVRIAAALIFTVVVCWQMWTQIPQYFHNYEVDRMNQESARQARNTGEMDYCIDYNPDYTHVKAYNDAYFYQSYLKSEELPPDTRINFYSEKLPSVWVDGEKASFPAVRGERYGYLLPLRDIVELLGGTIEVESGWNLQMEITLDGRVYQCTGDRGSSVITVSGISGDGSPFQVKGEISQGYYCTCLSENIYTDAFGLKLERSEDGMKIMLAFS